MQVTPSTAPSSSPSTGRPPPADFTPLQQSVSRFHGWEPLRVEGELPAELRGTLLRVGPGLLERFGRRLAHSFEADGALVGLRLHGTSMAEGAVRVVESPGYLAEQAAGRPLFGSAAPWWRRFLNGLKQRGKATGNTSVMHWQGRTYALMEGSRPVEVDARTLKTGEVVDLGGTLGATFSAHPHRVDSLRTTFNFGLDYGPKPTVTLYALPDEGAVRRLGQVPLPYNAMVHDFAVTERHAVFIVCPAKLSLARALLAPRDLTTLFRWDPDDSAELVIVPLASPEQFKRVSLDARFVFHLANAQERSGELRVDLVQYPNFDVLTALSAKDGLQRIAPSRLQRVTVDLRAGTLLADEVLSATPCDFPVLPAQQVGQAYSTLWLMTGTEGFDGGLCRLDVETGAEDRWDPGDGFAPSEPLFVPRPGASRDDEGWLISLVFDGHARESFFAVLDADRPSAGPIARLWMGQPLPLTFHGTFIPSA